MTSILLRVVTFLGYVVLLFFALGAAYVDSTIEIGLLAIAVIGFTVVNSRLLFPWPLSKPQVLKSLPLARLTLWVALAIGLLFFTLGVFGSYPLSEWRTPFIVLTATSASNLFVLYRLTSKNSETTNDTATTKHRE